MKKAVTLTLSPITVVAEGKTDKELLENAKKLVIEQLQKQFPSLTYSINEPDVLTFDNIEVGQIVETKNGDKGIVTAINKKTINVTLTGHRDIQGAPQAFKLSSASFEEARSKRAEFMKHDWLEGDTGYLKTKDSIKEVVVGKSTGNKTNVYVVNGQGGVYSLTPQHVFNFLKDDKDEFK